MTILTTERLAKALEEAGAPEHMIRMARTGAFDDYKSQEAAPLMLLRRYALENGLLDIAERVIDGEFDASREEADAWFNAEGKDILQDAGLDPDVLRPPLDSKGE